jgi:hypothetical protein
MSTGDFTWITHFVARKRKLFQLLQKVANVHATAPGSRAVQGDAAAAYSKENP